MTKNPKAGLNTAGVLFRTGLSQAAFKRVRLDPCSNFPQPYALKIDPRRNYWDSEEVDAWLEANKCEPVLVKPPPKFRFNTFDVMNAVREFRPHLSGNQHAQVCHLVEEYVEDAEDAIPLLETVVRKAAGKLCKYTLDELYIKVAAVIRLSSQDSTLQKWARTVLYDTASWRSGKVPERLILDASEPVG